MAKDIRPTMILETSKPGAFAICGIGFSLALYVFILVQVTALIMQTAICFL